MKRGRPSSPITAPAPMGISDLQLFVSLAGRMDSLPTERPSNVVMSRMTRAFSCRDLYVCVCAVEGGQSTQARMKKNEGSCQSFSESRGLQ